MSEIVAHRMWFCLKCYHISFYHSYINKTKPHLAMVHAQLLEQKWPTRLFEFMYLISRYTGFHACLMRPFRPLPPFTMLTI